MGALTSTLMHPTRMDERLAWYRTNEAPMTAEVPVNKEPPPERVLSSASPAGSLGQHESVPTSLPSAVPPQSQMGAGPAASVTIPTLPPPTNDSRSHASSCRGSPRAPNGAKSQASSGKPSPLRPSRRPAHVAGGSRASSCKGSPACSTGRRPQDATQQAIAWDEDSTVSGDEATVIAAGPSRRQSTSHPASPLSAAACTEPKVAKLRDLTYAFDED
eukprot:4096912-Prymnesium_polylepis.1